MKKVTAYVADDGTLHHIPQEVNEHNMRSKILETYLKANETSATAFEDYIISNIYEIHNLIAIVQNDKEE